MAIRRITIGTVVTRAINWVPGLFWCNWDNHTCYILCGIVLLRFIMVLCRPFNVRSLDVKFIVHTNVLTDSHTQPSLSDCAWNGHKRNSHDAMYLYMTVSTDYYFGTAITVRTRII